MLLAIEGIDASGKATQASFLSNKIRDVGLSVATVSFPRYDETHFSKLIANYLNGEFGKLENIPPHFPALLFALDRYESINYLTNLVQANDVVIIDRYTSSNMAHQASKFENVLRRGFIEWLDLVEHGLLKLPRAEITIFLDVPVKIASKLLYTKKRRSYTNSAADLHEENIQYLEQCRDVYQYLATSNFGSKWFCIDIVDPDGNLYEPEYISSAIWKKLAPYLVKTANSGCIPLL